MTIREKSEALYLERYAGGHLSGCEQAIPELRAGLFFVPCTCEEIRKETAIPSPTPNDDLRKALARTPEEQTAQLVRAIFPEYDQDELARLEAKAILETAKAETAFDFFTYAPLDKSPHQIVKDALAHLERS